MNFALHLTETNFVQDKRTSEQHGQARSIMENINAQLFNRTFQELLGKKWGIYNAAAFKEYLDLPPGYPRHITAESFYQNPYTACSTTRKKAWEDGELILQRLGLTREEIISQMIYTPHHKEFWASHAKTTLFAAFRQILGGHDADFEKAARIFGLEKKTIQFCTNGSSILTRHFVDERGVRQKAAKHYTENWIRHRHDFEWLLDVEDPLPAYAKGSLAWHQAAGILVRSVRHSFKIAGPELVQRTSPLVLSKPQIWERIAADDANLSTSIVIAAARHICARYDLPYQATAKERTALMRMGLNPTLLGTLDRG